MGNLLVASHSNTEKHNCPLPRVVKVNVIKSCHHYMLGSMRLASYGEFRIAPVVQACIHVPVVVLELIIGFVRFKAFPVFRNVFNALPVPSVKKFHSQ